MYWWDVVPDDLDIAADQDTAPYDADSAATDQESAGRLYSDLDYGATHDTHWPSNSSSVMSRTAVTVTAAVGQKTLKEQPIEMQGR